MSEISQECLGSEIELADPLFELPAWNDGYYHLVRAAESSGLWQIVAGPEECPYGAPGEHAPLSALCEVMNYADMCGYARGLTQSAASERTAGSED